MHPAWAALKRSLSVLREAGMIASAALPPVSPQDENLGSSPSFYKGNAGWRRRRSFATCHSFAADLLRKPT